jgi:hypothetical protein
VCPQRCREDDCKRDIRKLEIDEWSHYPLGEPTGTLTSGQHEQTYDGEGVSAYKPSMTGEEEAGDCEMPVLPRALQQRMSPEAIKSKMQEYDGERSCRTTSEDVPLAQESLPLLAARRQQRRQC